MLTIGCHLSKRRGYLEMAKDAASINANTFQYFTRSPRGSEQAALDEKDVAAYLAFAKEHGIHDALAYAPYDADPATDKMNERDFALMVYSEDLARLAEVDGSLYLIRPGSRLNISVEEGLADVADALNKIITPSMKTCVLLDTMAGEGTQVGTSFEQLAAIIAKVEHPEHVGVCFDCAGVWAEGYDIVGDLDGVLEEFDRTIGLNKLKAVHLNDATHERGSHVDRRPSGPREPSQAGRRAVLSGRARFNARHLRARRRSIPGGLQGVEAQHVSCITKRPAPKASSALAF